MKNLNKISKPSMMIISSVMAMSIATMSIEGGNILNTSYAASNEAKTYVAIGNSVRCKGSSSVNIRSTRSTESSKNIVGKMTPGTTALVKDKTPYWYKIQYGNTTGWVRWDTVSTANKSNENMGSYTSMKVITKANLNMRTKPSTNGSSVIATIPKGKTVTASKFYRVSKNEYWYNVSYNGKTGWISGQHVKSDKNFVQVQGKTGKKCLVRLQINTKKSINVRTEAGTHGKIKGSIPTGEVVTANRVSNGWYYVLGYNGWIKGDLTKPVNNSRSISQSEDMKVALISVEGVGNNGVGEDNVLNLISSNEASNGNSKTYEVYKISPAVNIGVNIEKVTVKVPEVETAIIDKLESGEIVGLNLSQERNDFRINSSSSLSSEDINKIVESLDYYVVNNTSAKVYKSVNELEDGTIDYKEMDYKLNDNEIVIVLEVDPSKDYVKVVLENGEIAYLETKALV